MLEVLVRVRGGDVGERCEQVRVALQTSTVLKLRWARPGPDNGRRGPPATVTEARAREVMSALPAEL